MKRQGEFKGSTSKILKITTNIGAQEHKSQHSKPKDRITIGLYSNEEIITDNLLHESSHDYNKSCLAEVDNIAKIHQGFINGINEINKKMAEKSQDDIDDVIQYEYPEIVVLINLIPDWGKGSNYENEKYIEAKNALLKAFQDKLNANNLHEIMLKYFYEDNLRPSEKDYLQGLISKGSNADMIKTHAVIDPENRKRRHLQLDSNTKISDYKEFYAQTFANPEQYDALNASYYDPDTGYISAHNKIVYTYPEGKIAESLEKRHLEYCELHKDDVGAEKTEKNSIYAKDFTVSLASSEVGLTEKYSITDSRDIYVAKLDKPEYRITKNVITTVNQSWASPANDSNIDDDERLVLEEKKQKLDKLKKLPAIKAGDDIFDYASFITTQNKYTRPLVQHKITTNNPYDTSAAYNQLMNISNVESEKKVA
ncbi:MAG: hypothetical protein K0S11_602 [Gammaproteobacteria bacterium]|nr:hypothetical protein [Gammaproteobacteria bacterium]